MPILFHRFIFIGLIILFSGNIAQAKLDSYVERYRGKAIAPALLARMDSYDHLVRYFSSFAYFVPGHQVNTQFVHALILAESSGNPKAVSHKNAYGLGQLTLATARRAALELSRCKTRFRYIRKNKLANLRRQDLYDPAINILLTCYLISKYNYRFQGRIELVVSAWNAGENSRELRKGKHVSYAETENLIGKVNAYYLFLLKNR